MDNRIWIPPIPARDDHVEFKDDHPDWPQPGLLSPPRTSAVKGVNDGLNGNTVVADVVPYATTAAVPMLTRIYAVWATAEDSTNADENNNTNVEFRVGTLASYTKIGDLNTFTTLGQASAAGEVLEITSSHIMESGKLMHVVITRNGAGGTNLNNSRYCFGFSWSWMRVG